VIGLEELPALLLTALPSFVHTLVSVSLQRRVDLLAGLTLCITALSGNKRLFLLRDPLLTGGLACLVSLAFFRLLLYFVLNYLTGIERRAWTPELRRTVVVYSLLWGGGLTLEALGRC